MKIWKQFKIQITLYDISHYYSIESKGQNIILTLIKITKKVIKQEIRDVQEWKKFKRFNANYAIEFVLLLLSRKVAICI